MSKTKKQQIESGMLFWIPFFKIFFLVTDRDKELESRINIGINEYWRGIATNPLSKQTQFTYFCLFDSVETAKAAGFILVTPGFSKNA